MARQQRTTNPRRSLNPATQGQYTPLAWQPISIAGSTAVFQLSQDSTNLVRRGVPMMLALSLADFPVTVVWAGATMELTWANPLDPAETFQTFDNEANVRTPTGGRLQVATITFGGATAAPAGTIFAPYCSGANLRGAIADGMGGTSDQLVATDAPQCGYTPPTPPETAWTATTDGFGNAIIAIPGAVPYVNASGNAPFTSITNAEAATAVVSLGSTLQVTFPTPVNATDQLDFPAASYAIWLDNESLLAPGPVTVT